MRALPLAFALVLALSGCSALAPSGNGPTEPTASPTETITPAPVETPTPTPEYPPGVNASGVESPAQLVNAHTTALSGLSFTVTRNSTLWYDNGTRLANRSGRVRVGADPSRYWFTHRGTDTRAAGPTRVVTTTQLSNGTFVVGARTVSGDDPAYTLQTGPDGEPVPPRMVYHGSPLHKDRLLSLLYAGEFTVESGTEGVVLHGSGFTLDAWVGLNATVTEFTAWVAPDGRVRGYRLVYEGEVDGQPVTGTERLTYSDVGETDVEVPPWFDETVENQTQSSRALAPR